MTNFSKIKKSLSQERYVQGFNAVPMFLSCPAWSCFVMKKDLGYSYDHMLFRYQKGYAEMNYFQDDLQRIWQIIKNKLQQDPGYLKSIKKKYEANFQRHRHLYAILDKIDLKTVSDRKLLYFLKKTMTAQTDSVGIGHVVEAIGQYAEADLKLILRKNYGAAKVNQYFIDLSVPSQLSFVAQEENDLYRISRLPKVKQALALKKHLQKYFWLQNTYRGPIDLTVTDFAQRLAEVSCTSNNNLSAKSKLIRKIKLSSEAKELVEIINLTTIWQDERKVFGLTAVAYTGFVYKELIRRFKIFPEALLYFSIVDLKKIKDIWQIKKMEPELKIRAKGTWYLWEKKQEWLATGRDYERLTKLFEHENDDLSHSQINGSIANSGTAIGRAVICKNISQIHKVKKGDILVSSMTRPEFMPAIKKAAAIVTDEGGITCHAAIVARELGIPAIIGTKIATKVLKDGDMVAVRANHGLIKILEK